LRRKREEDERRRKEAEEEIRRRAQEEQEQKRKEEERRSQEEEADRKRQAEAKESAETTNNTSEEQAAKRLHYVGMFVEMQKKEREQTKAQREAAKEARQLRANEKQANTGPGIAQALPQPSSPSPPTHARPSLPSKLPQQQPSPNSSPLPQRAAAVEENTAAQQESDMDREIEIIIEIGRLKEEVDSYKRRYKEEEAKVAELKQKIQRRAEAQAEAQRKRGWLSSSSSSSGGSVIKDRNPVVSVYQNKDITKRPLVGGARFERLISCVPHVAHAHGLCGVVYDL
jgi:hypothetical protein